MESHYSDFTSPIFTPLIGPKAQKFTAHSFVLCKSPRFRAQCTNSTFAEYQTKIITLKDHDPDIFAILLQFLYKGDYWLSLGIESQSLYDSLDDTARATQAQQEADLYNMAGYCQLRALQELVLEKMKVLFRVDNIKELSIHIYDNNIRNHPYRVFFLKQARSIVRSHSLRPWAQRVILRGGDLALDLYTASMDQVVSTYTETKTF